MNPLVRVSNVAVLNEELSIRPVVLVKSHRGFLLRRRNPSYQMPLYYASSRNVSFHCDKPSFVQQPRGFIPRRNGELNVIALYHHDTMCRIYENVVLERI